MTGLAGCYGTTEPATDLRFTSATLNGSGTTNNGPAMVGFEWWPTALPSAVGSTAQRTIPGGTTGRFSQTLTGRLQPATEYAFRLCGQDQGSPQPVCAQTGTFTTPRPEGDVVVGRFTRPVSQDSIVIAASDPSGANARGKFTTPDIEATFKVTCMAVNGNRAVVGGLRTGDVQAGSPALLEVLDGGIRFNGDANGGDGVGWAYASEGVGTPPYCSNPPFISLGPPPNSTLAVYDAP